MADILAQRLKKKTEEIRTLKNDNKSLTTQVKEQSDKINALLNHVSELEFIVTKWEKMQEKGYTAVAINDDYIVNGVNVLPCSTFIYTQDLPNDINRGYYYLDNGKIEKDIQKFRKYRGGL